MSGTDELENAKNGIGAANESIPSAPFATSDLNGHSESKGSSTAPAVAVDRSAPVVTSTTSTTSTSPSNWVQFGNGDDNSDNVSSIWNSRFVDVRMHIKSSINEVSIWSKRKFCRCKFISN